MRIEKQISTNKANLIFYENGVVEKIYIEKKCAISEMKSLKGLVDIFEELDMDGWKYKIVKIIEYDMENNKILMEKVKGLSFSKVMSKAPEYSVHMGIWLGHYHNNARVGNKVKIYGDYSRMNFIIDNGKKTATAIDPGGYFGEINFPEIDIVTAIYSVTLGALKIGKSPYIVSKCFIDGYNKISNERINLDNMKRSYLFICNRFKNKYKKAPMYFQPLKYLTIKIYNIYIFYLIKKLF